MTQGSEAKKPTMRPGAQRAGLFAISPTASSDGRTCLQPSIDGGMHNSHASPRFAPAALEDFVEAEEAAPFLHLCPRHLKMLARQGKVPAHPRGDGQRHRWLFLLSELDAWMRRRVNSACDPCRA